MTPADRRHDPAHTADPSDVISTSSEMVQAPGYHLRRMQQAYQDAWMAYVDPVVTSQQVAVLLATRIQPGVEQGIVGASVALDPSTMTGIVSRLVKRGWLLRRRAADDGRKRLLFLSDAGDVALDELIRRSRALDVVLMEGYGDRGSAAVVSLFASLARQWEALTTAGGESRPPAVPSVLDDSD